MSQIFLLIAVIYDIDDFNVANNIDVNVLIYLSFKITIKQIVLKKIIIRNKILERGKDENIL